MRVLLLPGDKGGCGLYRMLMPGRAITKAYPDVQVFVAEGLRGNASRDANGRVTVHSLPPIDADVVVFQRPLNDDFAAAIPAVQAQGVAAVVEFDDDFRNVSPLNFAAPQIHPRTSPRSNYEHLERAARIADLVTVSTPHLTRYAPPDRHRIIRNYVPESLLTISRQENTPLRLGWTGTVATHPLDLQETRGQIGRVLADTGAELSVVGDGQGVAQCLSLPGTPEESYPIPHVTGWVDLPRYPETVAEQVDVGLVPLEHTAFNYAKSYLKGLEFAAMGIPFVASATPEYELLHKYGAGLLAKKAQDWYRYPKRLLTDDGFRADQIVSGREAVAAGLTIERHAHEWVDAWAQAIDNRKKAMSRIGRTHATVG